MMIVKKKKVRKNFKKESPAVKKARRIKRLRLFCKVFLSVLVIPVVSVLFIFTHDALTQWSYFKTKKIIVQGIERISYHQILQRAGLKIEMNLLSINLTVTRKRLLGHPWIKAAEVRRELPDTLFLCVTEHQSLAVLDMGQKFVMNTDGEIFKKYTLSDGRNLPLITGLNYFDLKFGNDPGSTLMASVMKVLQMGEQPGCPLPTHLIRRINVDPQIGLTLYAFENEKCIRLGVNDYTRKLTGLKKVLSHFQRQHDSFDFTTIDLANPNRIVVFPTTAEKTADQQKEV
jgi:cell division protein FtsQ